MSRSNSRCPKLADLSDALASLSWSDVKCMAIHLHDAVDIVALDRIEQERLKTDERLIYCMHTWLQRDCEASWEKVLYALRKTKKNDLAEQIKSQYCASSRPRRSHSPRKLSPVEHFLPVMKLSHLPKEKPVPSRDLLSAAVAEGNVVSKISEESSRLEEHFISVVTQANIYFSEREAESSKFLNRLRITLTKLPLCKKYEHMHFLKEEKDHFKAAQDVSEIFDILDPYWNYFDYKLLEHLIAQFGDDTLKQAMHEYVSDLERFEKETSIQDYIDATCGSHEIPPELHTVIIKMDRKATECTLYDIRQFKESLANKSSLSAYTMYLKNLGTSSVIVTLAFPDDVLDVIIENLLEATFLDTHNITSVHISDITFGAACGLSALSDSDLSDPCSPSPAVSSINFMDYDMSPGSDEHPAADQFSVNILVFPPEVPYEPSQLGTSDLFSNDIVSENIPYTRSSAASSLSVPLDSDLSVSDPPSPAVSSINLKDDGMSPELSDHDSYSGASGPSPSHQSSKNECLKEAEEIIEHAAQKEADIAVPSFTTPHYPEDYSESGYGTVSNRADTESVSLESHGPRPPRRSAASHTSVTSKGGIVTETLC